MLRSMESPEKIGAWLESLDGERFDITANCSLGRSPGNDIVIDSEKASRRHAVIHLQNIGEFWLVDLGSTNGTSLNDRRVQKPVRLCSNDEIMIGEHVFKFRQSQEISAEYQTTIAELTIRGIQHVACWLLLADIEDFTPLSTRLPLERLALLLGEWMSACKQIVEERGGSINKYLGDGLLAYWKDSESNPRQVAQAIDAFKLLQERADLKFRIVVHFGRVAVGGIVSMGEESLMGKEVNLVFRLEKLAGSLGAQACVSDSANAKLQEFVTPRSLGLHSLKGFDKKRELFGV
jgi:adenylate cyclase